ncbi:hypothetical protein GBAR_LOCUS13886 [Geodia barretti]|uniref:Uncharacterized protein n=1 Tax=Geodia barretti TaxID=519541 RepID=A0AA35S5F6_GEOBA|nr:hypothetical protein GBAR_LOCUS13886 [Geodia barretti]
MHSREPADIISGSLSHGRLFEMSDLWKAVLESANIAEDSEDAKGILAGDSEGYLRSFMESNCTQWSEKMRDLCGSEEIFRKVEAFGHFVDEIDGKVCVDPKFCQLATTLMKKMSKQYDSEYDRETQFREAVNEYFPSLIVSLPKPKPNTFPISTDGTMTVPGLKKHIKA